MSIVDDFEMVVEDVGENFGVDGDIKNELDNESLPWERKQPRAKKHGLRPVKKAAVKGKYKVNMMKKVIEQYPKALKREELERNLIPLLQKMKAKYLIMLQSGKIKSDSARKTNRMATLGYGPLFHSRHTRHKLKTTRFEYVILRLLSLYRRSVFQEWGLKSKQFRTVSINLTAASSWHTDEKNVGTSFVQSLRVSDGGERLAANANDGLIVRSRNNKLSFCGTDCEADNYYPKLISTKDLWHKSGDRCTAERFCVAWYNCGIPTIKVPALDDLMRG